MKDLTKYFIDLSKLSEEQIKEVGKVLYVNNEKQFPAHINSMANGKYTHGYDFLCKNKEGYWDFFGLPYSETELTYHEFILLFEDGEVEILPDLITQLQADKEEMLEMLERIVKENTSWYDTNAEIESLIQKHKQ